MIELENVEKTYGEGDSATHVLKGISFRVDVGEYVAIMGTSGTGKTTLLNIIGCLDRPTRGHYRLGSVDMVNLNDDELSRVRNQKLGFVFQQFHLLERTSALKNAMLPFIYADTYPGDAEAQAEKALEAVGLSDRTTYRPNALSGGQQQRLAIARALITNPQILLADEPTGNLDSENGAAIMEIFGKLHDQGRTIILVTHDQSVAEHANRIIVLKDGCLKEDRENPAPRSAEAGPHLPNEGEGDA